MIKINFWQENICIKIAFYNEYFSPLNTFMRKWKVPDPHPDQYFWLADADSRGPKTCCGQGCGYLSLHMYIWYRIHLRKRRTQNLQKYGCSSSAVVLLSKLFKCFFSIMFYRVLSSNYVKFWHLHLDPYWNTDPDPATRIKSDPYGSGSATLGLHTDIFWIVQAAVLIPVT